jgi:thioredoxin reductase
MVVEVVIMTRRLTETMPERFDVVVIGGGAAGLSAALTLARARRRVLVIDAGSPRNAPADGVHGFLTRDGIAPTELLTIGRQEVERYGGIVVQGEARDARPIADGFEVTLEDSSTVMARRLVVTTGLVDELPGVPGLRERWGRDVLHCPYCHGWGVRDQPVGVLATSPWAIHQALLFRQWTPDVVLFAHTAPTLTDEQADELAARDIRIVEGIVESLVVTDDRLTGVRLDDGTVVTRRALVVAPRFVARSRVLESLGLRPTAGPRGIDACIAADATGLTEVPGVWVAGNVTNLSAQVVTAAAGGTVAAAAVNADLVSEDTRLAVAAYRGSRSSAVEHAYRRAS